jgi:hypothetical protein
MKYKVLAVSLILIVAIVVLEWNVIRFLVGSKFQDSSSSNGYSFGINTYDDWVNTTELLFVFRIKAMGMVMKGEGSLYGVLDREGWQSLVLEIKSENRYYLLYDGNDSNGIYCKSINGMKAYSDKIVFDDVDSAITWLKSASRFK